MFDLLPRHMDSDSELLSFPMKMGLPTELSKVKPHNNNVYINLDLIP